MPKNNKPHKPDKQPENELAKSIWGVSEELRPLYKIEETNETLSEIAQALHNLAHAQAMSVIATHGTEADRKYAVDYLKRWFEDH